MILKKGIFLAAILSLSIQVNASAQTGTPISAPETQNAALQTTAAPSGTQEVNAAPEPAPQPQEPSAAQNPAPETATDVQTAAPQAPAEPAGTQEVNAAPEPAPRPQEPSAAQNPAPETAVNTQNTAPQAPSTPAGTQEVNAAQNPASQPQEPSAAQNAAPATTVNTQSAALTAKDFILKQEELNYGVTLISKAVKMRIPFESNPVLIDGKEQLKTIAGRMFLEVKELPDNLNAMAINLMSYKKDDKEHDFGLIALELKESARADAEVFKGLIKNSMVSFFKDENFYITDKFPLIVIIAHNYPEGKKEDIKWAFDLAQKKFEK